MAAKLKKRTRIKVEEVEEAPKASPKTESSKEVEETTDDSVMKVTSFSQLDSNVNTLQPEGEVKAEISAEELNEENSDKTEGVVEKPEASAIERMESSTDVKEWLKDIRPDTTKDVEKGGNGFNGKLFFGLLILFVLLGALAGGLFYYKQRVNPGSVVEQNTQQPTTAPTVTPTLEVKVDLTTYTVNILNGSGTPGEAGVVKNLLVTAGFDADKVKTANASSYDYENTEVQVKVDLATSVTDAIIDSLDAKYTVEVLKENLKGTSTYDIVVTVGSKK